MRFFVKLFVVILFMFGSITRAKQLRFGNVSPKIVPETATATPHIYNSYCRYPIEVRASSFPDIYSVSDSGYTVVSVDAKFFASGFTLTGEKTGSDFSSYTSSASGYYKFLTGVSLSAETGYDTGTFYYYINATDITGVILTAHDLGGSVLATAFFKNTTDMDTGELARYFITGTGDESQMQSGVGGGDFVNIVTTVENTFTSELVNIFDVDPTIFAYTFVKRPCILDTDAPTIIPYPNTGINYFVDNFGWTLQDWTGSHDILQSGTTDVTNSTIHYYRTGGSYVSASGDIDNQMGVKTGCTTIRFSAGAAITGAYNTRTGEVGAQSPFNTASTLLAASLITNPALGWSTISANTGVATYGGSGSEYVWTGQGGYKRGYTISKKINLFKTMNDNQRITVTYASCDYSNQNGTTNSVSTGITLTVTGFDKVYPYVSSASYANSGWGGTGDTTLTVTTTGSRFSTGTASSRTGRTSGNVYLTITGSEPISILTGTTTGVIATYLSSTVVTINDNSYGTSKTVIFSGNYLSGWFKFVDNPPYSGQQGVNTGWTTTSGTKNYAKTFLFDIFWIDRTAPSINTGSNYSSGAGYANMYLSGNAAGYTGSTKDDEFKIVGYSGTTTPPVAGGRTNFLSGEDFSLITGNKNIVFNADWDGQLTARDRAGNTTSVTLAPLLYSQNFITTIKPEGRWNSSNVDYSLSTSSGWWFFWNTGTFSNMRTGNYASSGSLVLSSYGTGSFSGLVLPVSGDNYQILYKSIGHLSAGWTGNDSSLRSSTILHFDFKSSLPALIYNSYWFKKFIVDDRSGTIYQGTTYSLTANGFMDDNESSGFWALNPSSGDIITRFFSQGNAYTQNWADYNGCSISANNVFVLTAGSALDSTTLASNSIYILESGNHIITSSVGKNITGNCIALIGKGNVTLSSNVNVLAGIINIQDPTTGTSNVIIDNINIDGITGHGSINYFGVAGISTSSIKTGNITINNGDFYSGSNGLYFDFKSYITINNASTHNNGVGMYFLDHSNITVTNSSSYSNDAYGIYLYSGYSDNFTSIQSYNNAQLALYGLNNIVNLTITNGLFFNSNNGILLAGGGSTRCYDITFNNSQIYNNAAYGLWIDANVDTVTLNNSALYNNGIRGYMDDTVGAPNYMNNVQVYSNGGYGMVIFDAGDLIYYGTSTFFDNPAGPFYISPTQGTGNTVGWSTGVISSLSQSMSCNYATQPQVSQTSQLSGGIWYYTNTTCSNLSYRSPAMTTPISCYKFGDNLATQIQPVSYSLTGLLITNGSYSSSDPIGYVTGTMCPANISYLVFGDFAAGGNDIIGATDLADILNNITLGYNTYYSKYDYNLNSYIDAEDIAALINNSGRIGFRRGVQSGTVTDYPRPH